MPARHKSRALPGWPRALCEDWAATYLGQLSVSAFRTEVAAGRIPSAVQLTKGRKAWLIEDLDAYLDGKRGMPSDRGRELSLAEATAEWDEACSAFEGKQISSHRSFRIDLQRKRAISVCAG